MDPIEEFEFKPLTEGLGFHNRAQQLKASLESADLARKEIQPKIPSLAEKESQATPTKRRSYEDLLQALEKPVMPPNIAHSDGPEIVEPIGRAEFKKEQNGSAQKKEAYSDAGVLESTLFPPRLKIQIETGTRRGAADSPVQNLELSPICLPGLFLDGVVVFALSLIFIVSLLVVTKLDFVSVLMSTKTDAFAQLSFALLFVCVLEMYMVVARSFFGKTLGEWTFDHQLGTDEENSRVFYPLRVMFRSLVLLLTGLIVLPVLSIIFRKDLAGKLTGLRLYRQKI